jgi:hypothetical protein
MSSNRISSGTGSATPRVTGPRTATRKTERLDVTLEKMRAAGEPLAIPNVDGFIDASQDASMGEGGEAFLINEIIECVIPRIREPSIFRAGRPLALLEHLRNELLPAFEENSELRELASKVIDDEIARQRDILERIQSSIVV